MLLNLAPGEPSVFLQVSAPPGLALTSRATHTGATRPSTPVRTHACLLQMGKLFKRMGQLPQAQRHMEMALSFSASSADAASIKAAIDKLALSDEQEEEELL